MSTPAGMRRRKSPPSQFGWRTIEMLESPAFRVLSLSAHRVLARIEIEAAHHGGHDNGRLPVTYEQFEEYGIDPHCVAPAQRELCALGFIEITERGRSGNAAWRRPNLFRLTYRQVGNAKATDEWRGIKSLEDALLIARVARKPIAKPKKAPAPAVSAKLQ